MKCLEASTPNYTAHTERSFHCTRLCHLINSFRFTTNPSLTPFLISALVCNPTSFYPPFCDRLHCSFQHRELSVSTTSVFQSLFLVGFYQPSWESKFEALLLFIQSIYGELYWGVIGPPYFSYLRFHKIDYGMIIFTRLRMIHCFHFVTVASQLLGTYL